MYNVFLLAGAFFTALIITLFAARPMIRWLQKQLIGQVVRDDGPQSHLSKAGTPTMGGLLIILATVIGAWIWAPQHSTLFLLALLVFVGMGLLGWYDDFKKLVLKHSRGLRSRYKFLGQSVIALAALLMWYYWVPTAHSDALFIPYWKLWLPIGWGSIVLGYFVIVGASNSVNLTDGLDGLVSVPVMLSALGLTVSVVWRDGWQHMDILVLLAATIGAVAGFLWFNAHPARVFMGDVGALALGGLLGFIAVLARIELILLVMGGVFVIEALSVIIQVSYFKRTGRRVFKMAPVHHHFELSGWPETQVVVRFWLISAWLLILALMGVV